MPWWISMIHWIVHMKHFPSKITMKSAQTACMNALVHETTPSIAITISARTYYKFCYFTKQRKTQKRKLWKTSNFQAEYSERPVLHKNTKKKLVIIGASNVCAVADSSQWRCSSETLKHLNRSSYINFTSITSTSLTPPKKSTILMFALLQQRFCRNFITFYKFWSMKKIIPRVGHTKKLHLYITIKIFTTDYILYKEGSSRKRDEDQIMPRVKAPLPYRIQILFQDTIRKGWAKAKMAPVPPSLDWSAQESSQNSSS